MNDQIEKYLAHSGLKFPEDQEELIQFEKGSTDFIYQLDVSVIDPFKIYNDIKGNKIAKKVITIQKAGVLPKQQNYFMRVVLAAEIAYQLHNEPTFGSVKFQKLVYLCEHVSKMNFTTFYTKQTAGPFDSRFMYSIRKEFERLKWFNVTKKREGKYEKVKFAPMSEIETYKTYYQKYFRETDDGIQFLIQTFRTTYTREVELVATIFACWEETISEQNVLSDHLIINKVYNWAKEKEKFQPSEISRQLRKMQELGIYPKIE
jgi:type I restriction enzyme S subunit